MIELLTLDDVSKILRVSRWKTYEIARHPDFPAIRIGRHIRVTREALEAWLVKKQGSGLSDMQ